MKRIIVFLVLGLVFAACNPEKKYAAEISEINEYEKAIDSLEIIYNSIKFDSLVIIQKAASTSEKMIKKYYTADTISRELADKLQYIKSVRKSLSNIEDKKDALAREITTLKTQFSNLEIDVKNGILNKSQVSEFLEVEKKAFDHLSENLTNVVDNQSKQLKDYHYANTFVDAYVELIKPQENQE